MKEVNSDIIMLRSYVWSHSVKNKMHYAEVVEQSICGFVPFISERVVEYALKKLGFTYNQIEKGDIDNEIYSSEQYKQTMNEIKSELLDTSEVFLSIGNSAYISHGASDYGITIKEATTILNSINDEDLTNEAIFVTGLESIEYDAEELLNHAKKLKDIELEDNVLYEFNYHNYLDLIVVSKYSDRY